MPPLLRQRLGCWNTNKEHGMSTSASRSLEACLQLEYLLIGDLRELLEEPLEDDESRRWLSTIVVQLLETLHCEFRLKDAEGYMSEVLEVWPNWSGHVDRLCSEQRTLCARLGQLRYRLSEALPLEEVTESLQQQLCDWMATFAAHRRHETRLVQNAFNCDPGAGD
jgi:hypothetical protein